MVALAPTTQLNNGKEIPIVGLGTWNSPPGEVAQAIKDAIDAGYRHIDGAFVYENEHEVGEGVNAKISEGVVKREDLFITSKLWNTFHDPKDVRSGIECTLKQLNLKYLDLYLIHWPISYQKSDELFPKDASDKMLHANIDLKDVWKAMEELVDAGLTKSIGVSNFNIKQIDYILANARIKPVANQIEVHPYFLNKDLIQHCRSKNIVVTAYSPLGSPGRPWATPDDRVLMKEPKLLAIAAKYNKTPGQILIRYQVQVGNTVIPKSVTKERIISNFDVFNFKLTDEDIKDLESFGYVEQICKMSMDVDHPDYPF
ncbi:CLUMA_CG001436, isoform A [Clunio marinus]|uniref:CLUMA_CG001436, isoform A n=1 Tax=Clunio marinus TaxID=568069 RepID=A0A1J1HHX4_9DIPT|nr:CLUMA_CG001436, isoform A [Clunio marinus]